MKNALPKRKKLLNSLLCGKKYNHLKNNYFLSMRRVSKIWVYTCAFTVKVLIYISPWFFTWHANPYYKWVGKCQWYFYVLAWHKWLASSKGHLWFITEISVIQSSTIQGWFSFLLWPSHFLLDTADLEKNNIPLSSHSFYRLSFWMLEALPWFLTSSTSINREYQ